jgi:hypothetical protein
VYTRDERKQGVKHQVKSSPSYITPDSNDILAQVLAKGKGKITNRKTGYRAGFRNTDKFNTVNVAFTLLVITAPARERKNG